ncbi:hypothetical protein [Chelatococcus reniformis]|uniref:hypothetical protein n=1 Tax=Chelatococcus reniformis TaxID=1494448 RepID=UPI00166311C4|nr:hypothetical protein [Chelatococcus reniformis]
MNPVDRSFGVSLALASENVVLTSVKPRTGATEAGVALPALDLPLDHEKANEASACIGHREMLIVERIEAGLPDRSYHNVNDMIAAHGGELVAGWMLEYVPNVLIRAARHAVWRDQDGVLFDVTPVRRPADQTRSTFAPDEETLLDYIASLPVEDRYVVLARDADVRSVAVQYKRNIAAQRKLLARIVADFRYEIRPGGGLQGPSLLENYPDLSQEVDDSYFKMHRYRRRVLQRYFPEEAAALAAMAPSARARKPVPTSGRPSTAGS